MGGQTDQAEHGFGALPGLMLPRGVVGLDRLDDLVAHPDHGVERIHRALGHERDLVPAHAPQGF